MREAESAYQDVLLMLLCDEISRRDSGATERRAQQAGLSPDMVLSRWDASANVTYDRRLLQEICSLRFVADHRNLTILGPVGVGKTFWSQAVAHLCCEAGYHVRFSRADALLRSLRQSRMDNSREALMTTLAAVDVLVLDDFALEPMGREESRDIYQLFVERNGRFSTVVTSNRDTSEWIATFDDALLAQSAVDRFKNNAFDLIIDGESYRPRLKPRARRKQSATDAPRRQNPPPSAQEISAAPLTVRPVGLLTESSASRRPPSGVLRTRFPSVRAVGIHPYGFSVPSLGPMTLAITGPMRVAIGTEHAPLAANMYTLVGKLYRWTRFSHRLHSSMLTNSRHSSLWSRLCCFALFSSQL